MVLVIVAVVAVCVILAQLVAFVILRRLLLRCIGNIGICNLIELTLLMYLVAHTHFLCRIGHVSQISAWGRIAQADQLASFVVVLTRWQTCARGVVVGATIWGRGRDPFGVDRWGRPSGAALWGDPLVRASGAGLWGRASGSALYKLCKAARHA